MLPYQVTSINNRFAKTWFILTETLNFKAKILE